MHIGVIYYSQTGNTRLVAEQLEKKLTAAGHDVSVNEIKIEGKTPAQAGKFKLTAIPDPNNFDAVIFGAQVQAFSLNPVMKEYLEQLPGLEGKKAALFVTKQLPLVWTGGTGAVATMKKVCEEKGLRVLGSEIVVWSGNKRQKSIEKCAENLAKLF